MKIFSNISDRFATAVKVVILMGIISFSFVPNIKADAYRGVSFQVFYDELMPYGDWVHDPQHGFVWIPYVEQNFHPYATRGHWVMTSYGNTWVSQYDWGWAPFHYGRWFFTNHYGWAWVPGYEWGPAWVDWRTGGGYYGWAPLAPAFHVSYSVLPYNHYVFVPHRRLIHRNIHRYYVPRAHIVNVYNHTTIINNTYVNNNRTYIAGPDRREVERYSRKRVPVYQVNNAPQAGRAAVNNRSVAIYRPEVSRNTVTQARPSRVIASSEYNRGSQRQAAPRNDRSANVQQNNGQRQSGQEARRSQATDQNSRQNAVRSNEGSAARSAAPARSNEAVRSAAPSRTENRANPGNGQRTNNRTESNNLNGRENNALPGHAAPSQRTTARPEQTTRPTNERVNQRQQQSTSRPQQVTAPAQLRQQQVTAPAQQRQQQVTAPAQQRQQREAAPAQQRQSNVQQNTQRATTPTAVSNSRSTGRSNSGQQAEPSSTRSNSRSTRGNN